MRLEFTVPKKTKIAVPWTSKPCTKVQLIIENIEIYPKWGMLLYQGYCSLIARLYLRKDKMFVLTLNIGLG